MLYASGTAFPPLTPGKGELPKSSVGRSGPLRPAQANNCFVFPGVGMGVLTAGASLVSEDLFLAAAQALAGSDGKEARGGGLGQLWGVPAIVM